MAEQERDSALVTLAIVLLLIVVVAAVAKLARDDGPPEASDPAVPEASVSVPTGTPADRATPTEGPDSTPPDPTSTACVSTDKSSRLDVLSFNIHSARASDGSVRFDTIADEIARWDADVVLLQEVDRGREWTGRLDMPAVLAERLGLSWTFGANVRRSPTNEYGTAILSRFPIVASRNVPLPAPPGTQQRGLLAATLDVGGTEVSVYNTHLEHTSSAARVLQMRTITGVLAADDRPLVLGGDLNAAPGSAVHSMALRHTSDTWTAVGTGPGFTVSARNPRIRIDYLLYGGGEAADLEPVGASVLRSAVSDHWAVHAGYKLVSDSGEICVPLLDGDDLP